MSDPTRCAGCGRPAQADGVTPLGLLTEGFYCPPCAGVSLGGTVYRDLDELGRERARRRAMFGRSRSESRRLATLMGLDTLELSR